MNLCSDYHEEVCYEGRECPACGIKIDLEDKIAELENKLTIAHSTLVIEGIDYDD